MRRFVGTAGLTFFLCGAVLVAPDAAQPERLDELRGAALELVNESRQEHGLAPLVLDEVLNEAAQAHASDMLERDYHAHESPEGETARDRYLEAGGDPAAMVAENIAHGEGRAPPVTREDVERLHEGWMRSPGHRANILAEGMEKFGFGMTIEDREHYAVQMLAGAGSPPETAEGGQAEPVSPGEALSRALERVNDLRRDAGAPPLEADRQMVGALRDRLADADIAALETEGVLRPAELLSSPAGQGWRSVNMITGTCQGCGARPTAADIGFFVGQWAENPQFREILTDPQNESFALALEADGEGRKAAVAVVGR